MIRDEFISLWRNEMGELCPLTINSVVDFITRVEAMKRIAGDGAQAEPVEFYTGGCFIRFVDLPAGFKMEHIAGARWRVIAAPAGASPAKCECDFDAWMENPYTKVLQKSIHEDYVPKADASPADQVKGASDE